MFAPKPPWHPDVHAPGSETTRPSAMYLHNPCTKHTLTVDLADGFVRASLRPQGNVAARKELLRLSESAWADALMEVALCERELDDPFAGGTGAGNAGAEDKDASGGSLKVTKALLFFLVLILLVVLSLMPG